MANTIPSTAAALASMVNHNHNHNHSHSHNHNHNHNHSHNHNHNNSSNVPSRGEKESLRSSNSAFTSTSSLLSVKGLSKGSAEDLMTSPYLNSVKANSISNSANSAFTSLPAQSSTSVGSPGDPLAQGGNRKKQSTRDPLSHRMIEKRRRDRMNNCLTDLSRLIPNTFIKKQSSSLQNRGRIEKTEIIEMAIKYLKHLQSIAEPLLAEDGPLGPSPTPTPVPKADHDHLFQHVYTQMPNLAVMLMKDRLNYFRLGYSQCLVDLRNCSMDNPTYEAIYTKVLEQTEAIYDSIHIGMITKIMTTSGECPEFEFDIVIREKEEQNPQSPTTFANNMGTKTDANTKLTFTTNNGVDNALSILSAVASGQKVQCKTEVEEEHKPPPSLSYYLDAVKPVKSAHIELTTGDQTNFSSSSSSSSSTGHSSTSTSSSPDENVIGNETTRLNGSEGQLSPGVSSKVLCSIQNDNSFRPVSFKKMISNRYQQVDGDMSQAKEINMRSSHLAAALVAKSHCETNSRFTTHHTGNELRIPYCDSKQPRPIHKYKLLNILKEAIGKLSTTPSKLVPAFALHPSKQFYVPLRIESSMFSFEDTEANEPSLPANNQTLYDEMNVRGKRLLEDEIKQEDEDESETIDVISVKRPRRESEEKVEDCKINSNSSFLSELSETDGLYPIHLKFDIKKHKDITIDAMIGDIRRLIEKSIDSEIIADGQKSKSKQFSPLETCRQESAETPASSMMLKIATQAALDRKSQTNSPVDVKPAITELMNCTNNLVDCKPVECKIEQEDVKPALIHPLPIGIELSKMSGSLEHAANMNPTHYIDMNSIALLHAKTIAAANQAGQANNIHENGQSEVMLNATVPEANGVLAPYIYNPNISSQNIDHIAARQLLAQAAVQANQQKAILNLVPAHALHMLPNGNGAPNIFNETFRYPNGLFQYRNQFVQLNHSTEHSGPIKKPPLIVGNNSLSHAEMANGLKIELPNLTEHLAKIGKNEGSKL